MKLLSPRIFKGAACLVALSTLASAVEAQYTWAKYPIHSSRWVNAEQGFLGWIWAGILGDQDWIYPQALGSYLYLPQSYVTASGSWAYSGNLDQWDVSAETPTANWIYSNALHTWLYRENDVVGQSQGWIYVWNMNYVEVAPIVVDATNTADLDQETVEARYANSLVITPQQIRQMVDMDPGVVMTRSEEGVTFTSTASNGNKYVRIAFQNEKGLLDLTALEGISGRIGVDILADVDLSQTQSGFYVRLKDSNGNDVSTNHRLSGGEVVDDIVLQTSLSNPADEIYLEVTLPWKGSVTIKDIYLYMEDKVTGFADMQEKITGGAGATAENTHTVTNAAEFYTALQAVQATEEPSIIYVDGTLSYDDWIAVEGNDNDARQITLGTDYSNLSIIGVGNSALFDGLGLDLQGTNYIIQNITMRYVLARDAITVNNGTYVWIDHNTFYNESLAENPDKDKYDELISAKNNAHSVIISWNHIYDSHKTILVGSNDEVEAIPDRKLIMHHNWIEDCGSRLPLFRGGYAHIYNNFYDNIDSGINHRTKSKILIENNYFKDSGSAIGYWFDDVNPSGLIEVHGNIYDNVGSDTPTESTIDIEFAGNYQYTLDDAANIPTIVPAGAGAGKLSLE